MARARIVIRQLGQLLAQSTLPVYAVDESRCMAYYNDACARWLGVDGEQLMGVRCDYHAGEGRGRELDAAASLCPPPEAFAGQRVGAWVACHDSSGRFSRRRGEFFPLEEAAECGVLAVLESREEAEDARAVKSVSVETSQELHDQLRRLTSEIRGRFRPERLAGDSLIMRRVREQVKLAIAGAARVLVVGPPGSGREHVARTIHTAQAPDPSVPLMPLACAVLDAELLQTTVLAFIRRCDLLGTASQSTMLLLDVDQLVPDAQAELLGFLRLPTFKLRTIVTSRWPLLELAERETFSGELAYLLSTLMIELPSLAQRRKDIPLLAQQLLEEHNARGGRQLSGFAPAALDQLASLPWPGNIDELAAVVDEACRSAAGLWVGEGDLPQRVRLVAAAAASPPRAVESIVLDEFLGQIEGELLARALQQSRGNKAQAARLLGINRARLLRRLSQLGLLGKE